MTFSYKYPRPSITVDILLFSYANDQLHLLLIQRKNEPFKNHWAFPGGFVDEHEDLLHAAHRELAEETGLQIEKLFQFRAFGKPHRDPRGHTVSIAFFGFTDSACPEVYGQDDALKAEWFSISDLPNLAFDHQEIFEKQLDFLRRNIEVRENQEEWLRGKTSRLIEEITKI